MLLSEVVLLKGNGFYTDYYRNLGYDMKHHELCEVRVCDLKLNSSVSVLAKCDNCLDEKTLTYSKYIIYTNNQCDPYYCNKCKFIKTKETNLKKYGVTSPLKNDEIKKKVANTNLVRYGNVCSLQGEDIKEKTKRTNLEKYGVEFAFQNKEVYNKSLKTLIDNYGVTSPLKSDIILYNLQKGLNDKYQVTNIFQTDFVKEKTKRTNLEKYGVEYYSQTEEMKLKSKETSQQKYSSNTYFTSNQYKLDHIEKYRDKFSSNGYTIIDYDLETKEYLLESNCHQFKITGDVYYHRIINNDIVCTVCNDYNQNHISNNHKCIQEFIISLGINNIVMNYRDKLEIDIYLPDYNLGIEYNGLYWHSEKLKYKEYHFDKMLYFRERGIEILQIWEDEWLYKQKIVKSLIKNKLKSNTTKIYARLCEIRNVSPSDTRIFLDNNHIQGYARSNVKLGLYYNDELMSLMIFGYRNGNAKKELELVRFCNKINTNIVGGASKLFSYFIKNNDYNYILSYSDNCISQGNLYKILGFKNMGYTSLNYYWCKGNIKYHRFRFNKKKLIKDGFDLEKSETQIMYDRKYYKIWSAGQIRWVYTKN